MRALVPFLLLLALQARAANVCSAEPLQDELQYLRRLSLDLEGRAPTLAELERVLETGRVETAQLDGLLGKPQLKRIVRAWLRDAIYGNLVVPLTQNFGLARSDGTGGFPASGDVLWIPNRALAYRPRANGNAVPCLNEPARFNADGTPATHDVGDGYPREGWVAVHPYWERDPTATVKVCAFDAQAALRTPSGADCSRHEHSLNPACGCGPALRFCQGSTLGKVDTTTTINRALVEQALRLADRVVDEGRPLSDVLTLRELEVNGPLAHYLTWQTATTVDFLSRPSPSFSAPVMEFTNESWVRVPLSGRASGVLATPFYLLKFTTNRARANRFFNAFLCVALQAPPGGLPSPAEACSQEPDLSKRCGCNACHQVLEPAAAHWGRFTEAGTFELTDTEFPSFDATCIADGGALPDRCAHYVTRARVGAEAPYVGKLRSLLFASPESVAAVAAGPGAWAREKIDSKEVGACVTRRFFEKLVGRPFREDLADERALEASLRERFDTSGGDLGALLRAIVALPQYRTPRALNEPVTRSEP